MERANLLSSGVTSVRGFATLNVADIRRRFVGAVPGPDRGTAAQRGDHDLNPGMAPAAETRPAAVLVPLVERDNGIHLLLTQRTEHLAHHAGQVAFPGGRVEAGDADAVAAALREAEEEIGLSRLHVEPIGRLDRYITRTAFAVTPVVAVVHPPFTLTLDPHEVADAFEAPLDFLLDPANRERHTVEFQGVARHFYAMRYGERYIWGATAGMIVNLAELLAG